MNTRRRQMSKYFRRRPDLVYSKIFSGVKSMGGYLCKRYECKTDDGKVYTLIDMGGHNE